MLRLKSSPFWRFFTWMQILLLVQFLNLDLFRVGFVQRAEAQDALDLLEMDDDELLEDAADDEEAEKEDKAADDEDEADEEDDAEEEDEQPQKKPAIRDDEEDDEDDEDAEEETVKADEEEEYEEYILPPLDNSKLKKGVDGGNKVILVVLAEDRLSEEAAAQVRVTARSWLRADSKLRLVPTNLALKDRSTVNEKREAAKIDKHMEDAMRAYEDGAYDQAVERFNEAVLACQPLLEFPIYRDRIVKAYGYMGTSAVLAKKKREADEAFRSMVLFDAKAEPPKLDDSNVQKAFEAARDKAQNTEMGVLKIADSKPQGLEVYLDGEYKGLTPLEIGDVPVGEHTVKVSKDGYKDYRSKSTIYKGIAKELPVDLQQVAKYYPFISEVKAMQKNFEHAEMFTNVARLSKVVRSYRLLIMRAGLDEGDLYIKAYYYDMRAKKGAPDTDEYGNEIPDKGRHRALQKRHNLRQTGLVSAVHEHLDRLFSDSTRWTPNYVAPVQEEEITELEDDETPLYAAWWLWTIVGVVVVGGATAGALCGAGVICGSDGGGGGQQNTGNEVVIRF